MDFIARSVCIQRSNIRESNYIPTEFVLSSLIKNEIILNNDYLFVYLT